MKNISCKITISIIAALTIAGCLEVAGDGNDFEIIPDIQIECPGIICTASSSVVFVGFIKGTSTDCGEYLAGLNSTNYYTSFDAWGSTTASRSGPILYGTVTTWTDYNGTTIGSIQNGQYKVCGHYDLNNNQFLDPGEAVGEILIFPGTSPQILDDWYNI